MEIFAVQKFLETSLSEIMKYLNKYVNIQIIMKKLYGIIIIIILLSDQIEKETLR